MILRTALLSAICAALVFAQSPGLAVSGDIPAPLTLKADDLATMPRETATIPDPRGNKIVYEGVLLREILKRAGAPMGKESGTVAAGLPQRQRRCALGPHARNAGNRSAEETVESLTG